MSNDFPQGTVHQAGADMEAAVRADPALFDLWAGLTPLGRNEYLCWVEDAKQDKTRQRRIDRLTEDLRQGKRRPCCWPGCAHRTDKPPSPWRRATMAERERRRS